MKRMLVLGLLLAVSGAAMAQTEFRGRSVRLGFKLDPVFINNLRPADNGLEKDGSKFGFSYGLMADFMFSDGRGAFASGIEVTHASASLKYTDANKGLRRAEAAGAEQVYDIRLQYIQVPLSIKLKTNPNNGLRYWGQFGTYLGQMIGARADWEYGSTSATKQKILKDVNPLNMGLLIGAGAEYHIADKTDLFFGLGFENGFTDVTRNKKWNDGKVTLNRWALRLGVFF
jgi:hypothetical protein